MKPLSGLLLVLVLVATSACAAGPEPIRWGTDSCDQCRMVLDDRRFGVELVDRQVRKFDGLVELGRYMADHPSNGQVYVTDAATGDLLPASQAVLVPFDGLHGPMGGNVLAFASREAAQAFAAREHLHAGPAVTLAEASAGGPHASP
jgi:copper chaperone NosL